MKKLISILKRFSSFTDEKSQVNRAEAHNYKEYDLEVEGDGTSCMEYLMSVYAGGERFRFLLDSGADRSSFGYRCLKYFKHMYLMRGATRSTNGIIMPNRVELVALGLEPDADVSNLVFEMCCVETKGSAPVLYNGRYDGLLGATFLSRCEVDFRNAKIRVYPHSGEVVEALHIPELDAVIQKGIDGLKEEIEQQVAA